MLRFLAHDTVNDVALVQTNFGFSVRYGLQITKFDVLTEAVDEFHNCQKHALRCNIDTTGD